MALSPAASHHLRTFIPAEFWRQREAVHRARVAPAAEAFLRRRSRGETHPVWDFLFTYYGFSPGKLMTWAPAVFDCNRLSHKSQNTNEETVTWEWPPVTERVARESRWIAQLCANILAAPPRFTCHGLHEWAMVYRQGAEEVRHGSFGLRLTPGEVAAFVEGQALCCSHYDAFRFFTPGARPMNSLRPEFDTRLDLEQGGCLHANMDLYKWAYKLWPWIGSDLVADAFEVAVVGRELDMRASPYDLSALGMDPIRIETGPGREEYRCEQQRVALLAEPVRSRLRAAALRVPTAGMFPDLPKESDDA